MVCPRAFRSTSTSRTNGQPLTQVNLPAAITDVAINTDGKKIVATTADKIVRVLAYRQVQGRNELVLGQECAGHATAATSVALSTDGKTARVLNCLLEQCRASQAAAALIPWFCERLTSKKSR